MKHGAGAVAQAVLLWACAGTLGVTASTGHAVPAIDARPDGAAVRAQMSGIRIPFVENAGRYDASVRYLAQATAETLFVTADGKLVHAMAGPASDLPRDSRAARAGQARPAPRPGWSLVESFVGGEARPDGGAPAATNVSLFVPDPAQSRARVRTFDTVALGEVYPGIAVDVRATGEAIEKIFTVAPGTDPRAIRVRVAGALGLATDPQGRLVATTGVGEVAFSSPIAYQSVDGVRRDVSVRYALDGDTYGFALGPYDPRAPLVVDPLLQSTYLGAGNYDDIRALAIHPITGEIVVGGNTASPTFPGTSGGAQTQPAATATASHIFVARLSANLTQLLQATYIAGDSEDDLGGLVIDPVTGDVIVAGSTRSLTLPPPVGGGAGVPPPAGYQNQHGADNGMNDGMVVRLNPTLTQIKRLTFLGGNNDDVVNAIALDPATGQIIVGGTSLSGDFPGTTGGAVAAHLGNYDGFVARLGPNLDTLVQATFVGGSFYDEVSALAVHPLNGDIYAAGYTQSDNFVGATGGGQLTHGPDSGGFDAFISRLSPDLKTLRQSTYFGGDSYEDVHALVVHPASGEVYIAGMTQSNSLPGTYGGAQPNSGSPGTNEGYIARFDPALTHLLQATFLGGFSYDAVTALAIHPGNGEVIAGGYASDAFPGTGGGLQDTMPACCQDGFVARLSADLKLLVQSTYLGGSKTDNVYALVVNPANGELLVAGSTYSADLPGTAGGAQPAHAGDTNQADGFVVRLTPDLTAAHNMPDAITFAPQRGVPVATTRTSAPAHITGIGGSSALAWIEGQPGSTYCISAGAGCTCDQSGGGFISAPHAIADGQYACVRHVSSPMTNQITQSVLHVGTIAAPFVVSTGTILANCTLDIDGNGTIDALTDGLMLLRAMFGLTGTAVTNGAVGNGATRTTWASLSSYLNGNCGSSFSVGP